VSARHCFAPVLALVLAAAATTARAQDGTPTPDEAIATPAPKAPARTKDGLEALNPDLAVSPYKLEPGPRKFTNRLAFSPGAGMFGGEPLFVARFTYHPSSWLGYEWSIGHDPGQSAQAVLHSLSAIVRHPLSGRLQPYGALGYGMILVSPGHSLNADPVTKNALTMGGGLELYLRSDLAIRGEARYATVFGREREHEGVVVYDYLTETIGLSFYRSLRP
jgi:opacity protein-like surface antigen